MTVLEVIAIVSSVASLILAVVAIWLAIAFFRMSSGASKATMDAAERIVAGVERLEKLFDKLYSDTFSIMRDTVSDMRKYIWPSDDSQPDKAMEETERKADEKIDKLKITVEQNLSEILQRQRIADGNVSALRSEMKGLIDKAIVGSRQVEMEVRDEPIRLAIQRELLLFATRRSKVTAEELAMSLTDRFPMRQVLDVLVRMKKQGILEWGDPVLGHGTEIRFARPNPSLEKERRQP